MNSEGLEGQPHTIAADIWGTAPVALQWYKLKLMDPPKTSGADAANLDFDALVPDDAGIYYLQADTGTGRIVTDEVELEVVAKPVITVKPVNQTALEGTALNLDLTATGPDLNYQWET